MQLQMIDKSMRRRLSFCVLFAATALTADMAQSSGATEDISPSTAEGAITDDRQNTQSDAQTNVAAVRRCGSEEARNWAAREAQARYEALETRLDDDPRPVEAPGFAEANAEHDGGVVIYFNRIPPRYPTAMMARGVEATCAVFMDVSSSGRAFNTAVACTDEGFEPAVQAILLDEAFFLTKRENGQSVVARRIVLPFRFCMAN
jgi:hypothetical protein